MKTGEVVIACALGVASSVALAADTAGLYAGGGTEGNFSSATGWFFTANADLNVTQLGVLDLGNPGLSEAHNIGIFRASDGVNLVNATIGSGLSGDLIDGSRFVDVATTMLSAGEDYYIVADNWSSDAFAYGTGVTFDPNITWTGFGDAAANDIFSSVSSLGGLPGNLGANFRFDVVPAPSSVALLGVFGLAAGRRRR